MNETAPFGHRARAVKSASELLVLETAEHRDDQFTKIDDLVAWVMIRAVRGERVLRLTRTDRMDALFILGIPDALNEALRETFQLEAQQARGAWFIPETVSIKARSILLPALFREAPRYSHTLAADEKGKFSLANDTHVMVAWALLEPLADILFEPIFLRVEESGLLSRAEFAVRWTAIETNLAELGFGLTEELRPFAWGGGWSRSSADDQLSNRHRLLNAVAEQLTGDVVRRYRCHALRKLIGQYYAKARKGRAKRRQVVTKEHARTLAGFFAGDWIAFVRYLGEELHDEERVVTALPESRLIIAGGKSKAAQIASKKGLPVDEVERILRVFWGDANADSPVLARVGALREFWRHWDVVHARQAPGMPPLWGLVDDGGLEAVEPHPHAPYQGALYRRLLPSELVASIDHLWQTTCLTKWPDRVVSEPMPHKAMANTFGPALKFWHGCALTAWFVCEGPSSRTDIPGLAAYYRRELGALDEAHCTVDPLLFDDLSAVRLGPEEPITSSRGNTDVGYGLSFSVQISGHSRRQGFELLRDVITSHRRRWEAQYLDAYIRARWETELKATARQFHLMTEEKGKPPSLKQFAKHAVEPARHWFGGDVSLLYGSLGLKVEGNGVCRSLRMPTDRIAFVDTVFTRLGGIPFKREYVVASAEEAKRQAAEQDRHHKLRQLAVESLNYVQLTEAFGRSPTLKEFGSRFDWPSKVLAEDVESAWATYSGIVSGLLQASPRSA